MWSASVDRLELADAWVEGDESARWRSAGGHGPASGAERSGSSVLEVDEGKRLPRHVDTAEETIVVLRGRAEVSIGPERAAISAGGVVLVPREQPHEVRNTGSGPLRFVAIYAEADVVTRYEQPVEPGAERERSPFQ